MSARIRALIRAIGAWRARLWPAHDHGRPRAVSLVNQILSLQLSITGAIGIFALAGLAWTSQGIIDQNLSRWAEQWTLQLNELGAPLYVADPDSTLLNVERFVATYPEVARVDWYDPTGVRKFSITQQGVMNDPEDTTLAADVVSELIERTGDPSAVPLDGVQAENSHYRLLGSIWSESFVGDALMQLGSDPSPETSRTILGFVAIELDYSWYESVLASRLVIGCLALLAVLVLSWACGRYLLMGALQPLSDLQAPLAELASGNMNIEFAPARHQETQSIVTALRNTTRALQERNRRLSHIATHDSLTGLLNRYAFVEELKDEIKQLGIHGKPGAILFIDLDQFKYINDTCGHPAGDELLRIAARCISATCRENDLVARFGGDEFAVLARDVTRAEVCRIGDKILEQMSLLTQVHKNKVFNLQCSIGIAMMRNAALDEHEYLSQADIACHSAKENGRNRREVYKVSRRENQQMARDVAWAQRIREALENDSFVLVYQPLLRIDTGWTDHYEVLLRLHDKRSALVLPDAFLPAAVRFGLMDEIDCWVVEHAVEALARHRTPGVNMNFSINLSGAVFENENFGKHIESVLAKYDVPPDAIIFEITEQTAVRFAAESDKQIARLREMGCRFAIDDFGKGYSSFSYLRQLPVDYLKIDGSFVAGLENDQMNQTLVRAMGQIARAARIETIAECVESEATLSLLAELGIDFAQGYFVGMPSLEPRELELKPQALEDNRGRARKRVTQGR